MNKQFDGYNDLHNTYSVKHHVPSQPKMTRPFYKNLYENQLSVNKGLLLALGVTVVTSLAIVVGTTLAKNNEIEALRVEIGKRDGYIETANQSYNDAVSILLSKGSETPEQIINTVFGKDAPSALKVFTCESKLNPNAVGVNRNGSKDIGIAQINTIHSIPEQYLKNPLINVLVAKQIFDAQGWNPWVCKKVLQ